MGAVYSGFHLHLGIDVAVKCLNPALAGEGSGFVERFRREANLSAKITHENLIRVYDYRRAHGLHYLVMEFVDGESARERVARRGPRSEGEAAAIVHKVSQAMARAHGSRGRVVHRDIKPGNILISSKGDVRLADLGIAKALDDDDSEMLSTMGAIGTPRYMAPEQWENDQDLGPTADVWSLGATLYFLLAGNDAIRGKTQHQAFVDTCQRPFPDVRKVAPDVSPALVDVINQCVAAKIEDRFQDAGELARALAPIVEKNPVSLSVHANNANPTLTMVRRPSTTTIRSIQQQLETDPASVGPSTPPPTRVSPGPISSGPVPPESAPAPVNAKGGRTAMSRAWVGAGVAAAAIGVLLVLKLTGSTGDPKPAPVDDETLSNTDDRADNRTSTDPAGDPGELPVDSPDGPSVPKIDPVVRLADLPPTGEAHYTANTTMPFGGTIEHADGSAPLLRINGASTECRLEDGELSAEIALPPNQRSTVSFTYGDRPDVAFEVVQDSTDPVIEIVNAEALRFPTRENLVEIVASVIDANLDQVLFGDAPMSPGDTVGTYTCQAKLDREGPNELQFVAVDRAGRRTSLPLTVTRDTEGPELLPATQPAAGSEFTVGTKVDLELRFNEQITGIQLDSPGPTPELFADGARFSRVVPVGTGLWEWTGTAEDAVGNVGSFTVPILRTVPAPPPTPPTARWTGSLAEPGTRYIAEPVLPLRASISHATGAKPVVKCAGEAATCELAENGELRADVSLPLDQRSTITLDYDGSVHLELSVVQDSTDPVVTVLSPQGDQLVTEEQDVDVRVRVVDRNLGSVSIDGQESEPGDEPGTFRRRVTLDDLGDKEILIVATDKAGRVVEQSVVVQRRATEIPTVGVAGEGDSTPADTTDGADEGAAEVGPAGGDPATLDSPEPKVGVRAPDGWEMIEAASAGEWAQKVKEPRSGITFVLIPAGEFSMGSPKSEDGRLSDELLHRVVITRPFYLAETETSQAQYRRVASQPHRSKFRGSNLPVDSVTWSEASKFCSEIGCELPTEAQWEYACRAGTSTPCAFGQTIKGDMVNLNGSLSYPRGKSKNRFKTIDVFGNVQASFAPNNWGLYQMHGNVAEWCRDVYVEKAYRRSALSDPYFGTGGKKHVLRGGSWTHGGKECRAAFRDYAGPKPNKPSCIGFRCSLTLPEPPR